MINLALIYEPRAPPLSCWQWWALVRGWVSVVYALAWTFVVVAAASGERAVKARSTSPGPPAGTSGVQLAAIKAFKGGLWNT